MIFNRFFSKLTDFSLSNTSRCGSRAQATAATAVVVVVAAVPVGLTGASSVGEARASAGCESEAIRVGEAVVDEGATASGAERVGGNEVAADDEYRY